VSPSSLPGFPSAECSIRNYGEWAGEPGHCSHDCSPGAAGNVSTVAFPHTCAEYGDQIAEWAQVPHRQDQKRSCVVLQTPCAKETIWCNALDAEMLSAMEQSFQCQLCSATFSRGSHLRRHHQSRKQALGGYWLVTELRTDGRFPPQTLRMLILCGNFQTQVRGQLGTAATQKQGLTTAVMRCASIGKYVRRGRVSENRSLLKSPQVVRRDLAMVAQRLNRRVTWAFLVAVVSLSLRYARMEKGSHTMRVKI
jgi:hypothetical protein